MARTRRKNGSDPIFEFQVKKIRRSGFFVEAAAEKGAGRKGV
jgi:hypothetical protein